MATPTQSIPPSFHEVYALYQSYDACKEKQGKDMKISDLFLVKTKTGGFEFVKRRSFQGVWLRVTDWVKKIRGKEQSLVIDRNLQEVSKKFGEIYGAVSFDDEKTLNELAKNQGLGDEKGKVLRENIFILATELNSLKRSVEISREKKTKTYSEIPNAQFRLLVTKIEPALRKAQRDASFYEVQGTLKAANLSLNEDELNAVVNVVIVSQNKNQILKDVTGKQTDSLLHALREATASGFVSAKDKEHLLHVREKLAPIAEAETDFDPAKVHHFVTLFCSSFIAEQKEGDLDSMRDLSLEFLKAKSPDLAGIDVSKLQGLLENAVVAKRDMKPAELNAQIQQKLKTSKSCFVFGLDPKSVAVTEICKDKDGYIVRVYNQEPQRDLPSDIGKKVVFEEGYHEFRGVSEKELFSTFSTDQKPEGIFARFFSYFSTKEITQEIGYIQHLLRPELPGTTASKSLRAALMNSMDQKSGKVFQFEYDLYLLDQLEPQITALITKPLPENYHDIRSQSMQIRASIEQFQESLAKFDVHQTDENALKEKGYAKVLYFHDLLDRLDRRLVECEKTAYTTNLSALDTNTTSFTVADPKAKAVPEVRVKAQEVSVNPSPIDAKITGVCKKIHEIPEASHSQFSAKVLAALEELSALKDSETDEYMYACDLFCKKMGSIDAWDKVSFSDTKKGLDLLEKVAYQMVSRIDIESLENAQAEYFAVTLFMLHGLEAQMRKLPVQDRLLADGFVSILSSKHIIDHIAKLKTTDPFWSQTIRDYEKFERREALLDVSLSQKSSFTLSKALVESISKWRAESPMGKKITASIAEDRKVQEARIKREVEEAKRLRQECVDKKGESENTLTAKRRELSAKENKLHELKEKRDDLQNEDKRLQKRNAVIEKTLANLKHKDAGTRQKAIADLIKQLEGEHNDLEAEIVATAKAKGHDFKRTTMMKNPIYSSLIAQSDYVRRTSRELQYFKDKEKEAVIEKYIKTIEDEKPKNEKRILEIRKEISGVELLSGKGVGKGLNTQINDLGEEMKAIIAAIAQIEKEIKELTAKITFYDQEINGGIERRVHADEQYWAWGIAANDPADVRWTNEEVAAYFFARHPTTSQKPSILQRKCGVEDVLPENFRHFCDAYMIATNLFYKTEGAVTTPIPIGPPEMTAAKRPQTKLMMTDNKAPFNSGKPFVDMYQRQLVATPVASAMYSAVYSTPHMDEASVPHFTAVELQKSVAEQKRKQQNFLASLGERLSGLFASKTQILLADELHELCQLHVSPSIQVDATISFFYENPQRLSDPQMRVLFHALLFESDFLSQKLQDPASRDFTIKRLHDLFNRGIESAQGLEDMETAADLAWLAASAQCYLDSVVPSPQQKASIYAKDNLMKLFENVAAGDRKNWPHLFESLLAASHKLLPEKLEGEEDKKLFVYALVARAMSEQIKQDPIKENAVRSKEKKLSEIALKERVSEMPAKDLCTLLHTHAKFLLGKAYAPLSNATFTPHAKEVGVFEYKDGKKVTTLSVTEGALVSTDPAVLQGKKNPIPKDIKELLVLQKVYSSSAELYDLEGSVQNSIWEINDSRKGIDIKIDSKNKTIFVKKARTDDPLKKEPMPWCQHLPKEAQVRLDNTVLTNSYVQWCDPRTSTLYLCDPHTLEVCYVSTEGKLQDVKTGFFVQSSPPNSIFNTFEDPACTIYLADEGGSMREIQFPRHGLCLEKDALGNWQQKGNPDWKVSREQYVPHLEQKTGFLLFENSKLKEKKVLFPLCDVDIVGKDIGYVFNPKELKVKSVEVSQSSGALIPQKILDRYFLAKMYLSKGNIAEAEKLLYASIAEVSSRRLTDEEVHELRQIALDPKTLDVSPKTIRLRMHALYLLKRNSEQFPKEALKEEPRPEEKKVALDDVKKELTLFMQYNEHVSRIKPLPAAHELRVLENLKRELYKLDANERAEIKNDEKTALDTRISYLLSQSSEVAEPVTGSDAETYTSLEGLLAIRKVEQDAIICRELASEYFTQSKQAEAPLSLDLLFSDKSPEIQDQVTRTTFKDMVEDVNIAKSQLQEENVELVQGADISVLQERLESTLVLERNLLANEETQIVQAFCSRLKKDPVLRAQLESGKRAYPTIDELCVLCARKEYESYVQKLYPTLTKEEREALKEAVQKYLFQKENVQQLDRSLKLAKALQSAPQDMQAPLQKSLSAALKQTRAYPADHRLAMIFLMIETTLNIKLRPDQVQNIIKFDKGILDDESLVLQMIMGAGKTSVIQPVLAILLAKPDTLSAVMVPEAQFQSVRDKLVQILGATAGQLLITVPYDRELSDDVAYLESTLQNLKAAKDTGACLLLAPRQKHSINTSLYEAFYNMSHKDTAIKQLQEKIDRVTKRNEKENERIEKELAQLDTLEDSPEKEIRKNELENAQRILDESLAALHQQLDEIKGGKFEKQAQLISEISDFLQKYEFDQIDEIDMIANSKIVFKRPIGDPVVFDQENQYERSKIISELLLSLARDNELSRKVSIDFVDKFQGVDPQKKGQAITEALYYSDVQPVLVTSACELLKRNYALKQLIENNPEVIRHYLTQTPSDTQSLEEIQQIVAKSVTDKDAQALLSSLTHAISSVLSVSLLKECNSHYGKDPAYDAELSSARKFVARPYEAPRAPKSTMYADAHEKIIYSVQSFLFSGISKEDAKEILLKWKEEADREVELTRCPPEKAKRSMQFAELGMEGKLRSIDPNHPQFDKIAEKFIENAKKEPRKHAAILEEFFLDKLYKQVTIYPKDVTSTPQTLMGSSKQACGYTGTIHPAILSETMKAIPEFGTDGKTVSAVQQKLISGHSYIRCVNEKEKTLTNQVIDLFQGEVSVFIDSGGWLKEVDIDEFAKQLLEKCNREEIEGIVYHDKNNKIMCLEKGNPNPVPFEHSKLRATPEKRLTIIQQKFETGTDITQTPNAKAVMSARKNMTLRDSLQSMFRMRQVLHGQSVSIAMTDDVKDHMAETVIRNILSDPEIKEYFDSGAHIDIDELAKKLQKFSLSFEVQDACIKAATQAFEKTDPKERVDLFLKEFLKEYKNVDSLTFWRYVTANQAKSHIDKNWQAARYRMKEALEKPLRAVLTDGSIDLKKRQKFFEDVESAFVHTEVEALFETLCSKPEDLLAKEVVAKIIEGLLKTAQTELDPEIRAAFEANIISLYAEDEMQNALQRCFVFTSEKTKTETGKEYTVWSAQVDVEALKDLVPDEHVTALQNEIQAVVTKRYFSSEDEAKAFVQKSLLPHISHENRMQISSHILETTEIDHPIDVLEKKLHSCVNYDEIPEKITVSKSAVGEEREAESQRETEQERQVEQERTTEMQRQAQTQIAMEKVPPPQKKEYTPLFGKQEEYHYDMNQFISKGFAPCSKIVPASIKLPGVASLEYSPNLFLESGQIGSRKTASYHLASRFVLGLSDGSGKKRYVLVSHEDAARIQEGFKKSPPKEPNSACLYDMMGNPVVGTAFNETDVVPILAQAKICCLHTNFSQDEIEVLDEILKASTDPTGLKQACLDYYKQGLQYLPTKGKDFTGSSIDRLLAGKTVSVKVGR